jgi:2-polyprenyl-3-methyl-5-hydroxy-6-metoxy-1,4-benzoquinol methylase
LRLTGIDANAYTTDYARRMSVDYPEIEYRTELLPSPWLQEAEYDLVLSTLFLHHFPTAELLELLHILRRQARVGIVVNDLHRHRLAYVLFQLLTLPISNRMVREDGLVSILRGFKRAELQDWTQKLAPAHSQIRWRWAFRYQWIIGTSDKAPTAASHQS